MVNKFSSYALECLGKRENNWFPRRPNTSGKLGYYSAKQKWVKFIDKPLLNEWLH